MKKSLKSLVQYGLDKQFSYDDPSKPVERMLIDLSFLSSSSIRKLTSALMIRPVLRSRPSSLFSLPSNAFPFFRFQKLQNFLILIYHWFPTHHAG